MQKPGAWLEAAIADAQVAALTAGASSQSAAALRWAYEEMTGPEHSPVATGVKRVILNQIFAKSVRNSKDKTFSQREYLLFPPFCDTRTREAATKEMKMECAAQLEQQLDSLANIPETVIVRRLLSHHAQRELRSRRMFGADRDRESQTRGDVFGSAVASLVENGDEELWNQVQQQGASVILPPSIRRLLWRRMLASVRFPRGKAERMADGSPINALLESLVRQALEEHPALSQIDGRLPGKLFQLLAGFHAVTGLYGLRAARIALPIVWVFRDEEISIDLISRLFVAVRTIYSTSTMREVQKRVLKQLESDNEKMYRYLTSISREHASLSSALAQQNTRSTLMEDPVETLFSSAGVCVLEMDDVVAVWDRALLGRWDALDRVLGLVLARSAAEVLHRREATALLSQIQSIARASETRTAIRNLLLHRAEPDVHKSIHTIHL